MRLVLAKKDFARAQDDLACQLGTELGRLGNVLASTAALCFSTALAERGRLCKV